MMASALYWQSRQPKASASCTGNQPRTKDGSNDNQESGKAGSGSEIGRKARSQAGCAENSGKMAGCHETIPAKEETGRELAHIYERSHRRDQGRGGNPKPDI